MKRPKQFAQTFVKSHPKLMLWLITVPVMAAVVAIQHLDPTTNALHLSRSTMLNECIPGMLAVAALFCSLDILAARSKWYLAALGASFIAPMAVAVAVFEFLPAVGHRFIPVPAPLVWLNVFGLLNVVICRNFLRRRIQAVERKALISSESLRQNTVAVEASTSVVPPAIVTADTPLQQSLRR